MVDLHSHVLPGLDDGARTLEESVEMIRMAAGAGTTDLVATPHANLEYSFDQTRTEEKLAELAEKSGGVVRLYPGCDFHLSIDNIHDALRNPAKYTINHKNYLLVEFADTLIPKPTEEVFARMGNAGLIPVVTHPERNFLLHTQLDRLIRWVENGCLMQVTAASFLGRFGTEARDFARLLMDRGAVHFVASDAHDCQDRTTRLDEAYEHVRKRWGGERAERLFVANPRAVLTGDPLPEAGEPAPEIAPAPKWYQFWR
ncbi:MAG: CpsB/CapC family capsule biosynthesis tyrosine phosphatase [Bryobacteraceae bacterium]